MLQAAVVELTKTAGVQAIPSKPHGTARFSVFSVAFSFALFSFLAIGSFLPLEQGCLFYPILYILCNFELTGLLIETP